MKVTTTFVRVLNLLLLTTGFSVAAATTGAPLKGIDVKLARSAGGTTIRTVRTDDTGKFDFGVLPKGSYVITVGPDQPRSVEGTRPAATGASDGGAETLTVSLSGTTKGKLTYLQSVSGEAVVIRRIALTDKATNSSGTTESVKAIKFDSDGQQPVNGTIVKAKSNITNN